jgi:hypothetical protein
MHLSGIWDGLPRNEGVTTAFSFGSVRLGSVFSCHRSIGIHAWNAGRIFYGQANGYGWVYWHGRNSMLAYIHSVGCGTP